jgi:hypothetical protein
MKTSDMPIHQSLLRTGSVKSQEDILKSYTSYFDELVSKQAPPHEQEFTEEDASDPVVLTKNLTQNIDNLSMLIKSFGQELTEWMAKQENQK